MPSPTLEKRKTPEAQDKSRRQCSVQMPAATLRQIQNLMGDGNQEFADRLDISLRTLEEYRGGRAPIQGPTAILLYLLLSHLIGDPLPAAMAQSQPWPILGRKLGAGRTR